MQSLLFTLFILAFGDVLAREECRIGLDNTMRSSKIYLEVFKFSVPQRTAVNKTEKLPDGHLVNFECGNGFVRKDLPSKAYAFQCTNGKYNRTFPFEEMLCRSDYHKNSLAVQVAPSQLQSKIFKCDSPDLELYEIKTTRSDGSSKLLYSACLDSKVMRPKFVFQPSTNEKPPRGLAQEDRNDVWGFDGYGKSVNEMLTISRGYVENIQKNRTTSSFPQKYNSKKPYPYYFNRGHLAPYADFVDAVDRKATCEYINAAPQWEAFNKNSWSIVEREARQMRQENTKDWEVYTGTYGEIPTTRGPLFIAPIFERGKFKKGLLPVPMLYWKLVHNLKDKSKSKAFVGVNNPEIKSTQEIINKYKFCTPIHGSSNTLYEGSEFFGFTYQCKVDDFVNALKANDKIIKDKYVL